MNERPEAIRFDIDRPEFVNGDAAEAAVERKRGLTIHRLFGWFVNPPVGGPKSVLLLRLMAGGVFLWEGILKFVYANQGVGRFTKLAMPFPHLTPDSFAYLKIVGGLLL